MNAMSGGKKTVAILGASSERRKFGNKSVRAHLYAGWKVFPVNPRETEVEGLPTFRALSEISEPLARISVYLPPAVTLAKLPEIAVAGAKEVWFNPGAADESVFEEARKLGIQAIDGCSIVDLGLSPSQFP